MAYTARQLIIKSYYLSGIVPRSFRTSSGEQLTDGLHLLNALLAVKSIHETLIPYYQEHSFNAVIGQEKYTIPNLLDAETLTFNIGPVRYSMKREQRVKYHGSSRIDNVTSLPFNWEFERCKGGANIYIYFVPNVDYPMKVWGKFGLSSVADESVDLSAVYDDYYIEYLRYALAEYICAENNMTFKSQAAQRLAKMEAQLKDISPLDLSIKKVSYFTNRSGFNWGDVNIGHGWRP